MTSLASGAPPRALTGRRAAAIGAALIPPIAAAVAWRALPNGWFYADDLQVLYEFANGTAARVLFAPAFGHLNTTRNAVIGLLFAAVGPSPAPFFVFALLVHALNAYLVFRVASRLTRWPLMASAVATAWAISPVHGGTLDWIAVHGQAWATTLVLLMLDRLISLEEGDRRIAGGEAVWWGVAWLLVNTSFTGVASTLPLAAIVIVGRRFSAAALAAMGLSLLVVAGAYLLFGRIYPTPEAPLGFLATPALRDVLQHPIAIVALTLHLTAVSMAALGLGPLFHIARYPEWWHWIAAAAFLAVVCAGWRVPDRRRWTGGLLLLGWGMFPLIAVGRIMIAPDRPAAVASGARYYYFAQAMLALTLAIALAGLRPVAPRLLGAGVAVWVCVLAAALGLRPLPVGWRGPERRQTARALAEIRAAAAAAPPGSTVYIPNRPFAPASALALFQGEWTFPGLAGVLVIFFPSGGVDGRQVRVVAGTPAELAAAAGGGRIATLLVPPTPQAARP